MEGARMLVLERHDGESIIIAKNSIIKVLGIHGDHVHHRTYDRLGHEEAADLVVLCGSCHDRFHDAGEMPEAPQVHYHNGVVIDDGGEHMNPGYKMLLCPVCQFECTHIEGVEIGEGYEASYTPEMQREALKWGDPIPPWDRWCRGWYIAILMSCESDHRWLYTLQHHKGNTFVGMTPLPQGAPSRD